MNNLPQSTDVRAPQPIGPGLPAPLPPITVSAAASYSMTGRDVWRVIRNNLWLIILLMIVFGAGGYALNWWWAKNWPVYTAKGTLQLTKRTLVDPMTDKYIETADVRLLIDQRSQAQIMSSEPLFAKALSDDFNRELRETDLYKQFLTPDGLNIAAVKEYLRDNFRAQPIPDTNLIFVTLEGAKPSDLQIWLRQIVDTHLRSEAEKASAQLTSVKKQLQDQMDSGISKVGTLRDRVARTQKELEEKARQAEVQRVNLTELTRSYQEAVREAAQARGLANHIAEQLKRGEPIADVERLVAMDPLLLQLTSSMSQADIAREMLKIQNKTGTAAYDAAVALADETRKRCEEQEQKVRSRNAEAVKSSVESAAVEKESSAAALKVQIEDLQSKLQTVIATEANLRNYVEQQRKAEDYNDELNSKIQILTGIDTAHSQDPIRWTYLPELPQIITRPQLKWVLPIAMMLGLVVAAGLAFLRELLDDTVRTPRDVSRFGQMNLLGMIADEADDPQAEDAPLAIFDAPQSATAEQFRQVRARLLHASSMDQLRSILVTGPTPMDGKTTVAANVAAAMALNGRKVLLVDGNFRRPQLHRLFGFENNAGFSDVLNAAAPLKDTVRATRIPNLAVLTSGAKPANATELLESRLLVDFLEAAAQDYDHVIFDSGPILIVSESAALASRVDGVITVVRAHAASRGLLQRMRDALRQLKAEHIGVVLNAVRSRGGGYYRRNIKAYYRYQNGK